MTFSRNHHGLFPDLVTHDSLWIDACQSLNIHADGHTDGRRTGIRKEIALTIQISGHTCIFTTVFNHETITLSGASPGICLRERLDLQMSYRPDNKVVSFFTTRL